MRIELFTTSTEPEFAQDCEAVQSPNASALATVDHNASIATGRKISQRFVFNFVFVPNAKHLYQKQVQPLQKTVLEE